MSRDMSTFSGNDTTFAQGMEDGAEPVSWLVGRYEVGELLGRGGSGQVHRAHDHLLGEAVAVKFVSSRGAVAARLVRRELTALRLLDLPGVVRLRDDGELAGGGIFIVMDLLSGGTFERVSDWPWARQREAIVTLLESLARVHFAGVVHRDLKPGNVLLDQAERPVITDFGLAAGAPVEDLSRGYREGTPRYMAPEQARGGRCDGRTDLFALGVMLEEGLADDAPAVVWEVARALQAPEPGDRPDSVVAVLEALGESSERVMGPSSDWPAQLTDADVVALFDETTPTFLHLAEDAARLLQRRTQGGRDAVQTEISRWVRDGRCHWNDGRVRMERTALEQVALEPFVGSLLRSHDSVDAGEQLVLRALDARQEGRAQTAMSLLDAAIPLLQGDAARRALEHLVAVALSLGRQEEVRRATYRCDRAQAVDLRALLRGVALSWGGDRARAIELLSVPVAGLTQEPELARWAHLVQACCAVAPERLEAVLAEARMACVGDEVAEGRWSVWRGHAHYATGEFDAALVANQAAIEPLSSVPTFQLAAIMNGGQAALEAGRLETAVTLAEQAERLAATLRHGFGECRAVILRRHARYRSREPLVAEPELVNAAARVSRRLELEMAAYEAIIGRDQPVGRALAARASSLVCDGDGRMGTIAVALGCALHEGPPPPNEAVERLPGPLRLQVEAMLVGLRPPAPASQVQAWVDQWQAPPDARRDVYSLQECLSRLGQSMP